MAMCRYHLAMSLLKDIRGKRINEFKGIFGSADGYLQGAQDVMLNGVKVPVINPK